MKVEVLYFAGCPNHEPLLASLRAQMTAAGIDAHVELRAIESPEAAQRERFLGSPTLRVDGEDAEAVARERTDFGLNCRLYKTREGLRGSVPDAVVRAALLAHAPLQALRVPPRAEASTIGVVDQTDGREEP